ncbi:hypothetical protein BO82DRAFT_78763 [Aspergillus uvarum CBS 121591]|uniref:Uncharacterized protein n=1 Tax=Aspergillus uvarum CBS 121591 TaxID=1448315 RepID=A0A319C913_9EURO|nr:hypothetical protein BO82DRAFT_78763 [Aspergillus uvarum CBS 121591]PYH81724.1 hypothetical protein BO82DRAFT_78763 [Aspergillus uvarum CBS 121591]
MQRFLPFSCVMVVLLFMSYPLPRQNNDDHLFSLQSIPAQVKNHTSGVGPFIFKDSRSFNKIDWFNPRFTYVGCLCLI